MWPFSSKKRSQTVEELIEQVPIKSVRDNLTTIENSLKIVRSIKSKIGWVYSTTSNPLAIELMEREHLVEFSKLRDLIIGTRTMIALILRNVEASNVYKFPQELLSYLNLASHSLDTDIHILNTRVPESLAA